MNAVTWRPAPWIAALLGLFGGGLGLLYVQRPWFALAYFTVSLGSALALLYAMVKLDLPVTPSWISWIGWVVSIVCALHAYKLAHTATAVSGRKWYSRWYGLAGLPLGLFLIIFLFRSFAYEPYTIPSESMHPTLPEGSLVFVSKSGFGSYGTYGRTIWRSAPTTPVARADMVAYRLTQDPTTTYLHRIVGLPGDRIEYTNRRLVINGSTVPMRMGARAGMYQYAVEQLDGQEVTIALMPERAARDWAGVVPPDHYVVFGDSRDNSRDSRYLGFVPRDRIVGRVVKIVYSRRHTAKNQ
jgi:signal peptidase I